MMNTITLIFGAGAEGYGQLGLPSGASFIRDIVCANNVDIFANHILKINNDHNKTTRATFTLNKGTILHQSKSSVLYQTIIAMINDASYSNSKIFFGTLRFP